MVEVNKEIVRRIYDEVINQRDLVVLEEIVAPAYVEHDPFPGQGEGIQGMKDRFTMLVKGLDPHFSIDDMVAEGDKVAVRWTNRGTSVGEFLGAPATGKSFEISGIDIYRLEEARLVEHWHVVDVFGLLAQLGLIPVPQAG